MECKALGERERERERQTDRQTDRERRRLTEISILRIASFIAYQINKSSTKLIIA